MFRKMIHAIQDATIYRNETPMERALRYGKRMARHLDRGTRK